MKFISCFFNSNIDWIYTGELPEFITSPSSNEKESKAKLGLTLNMLSLAHCWEITELHQYLQEFIVNTVDFLNPYWVEISKSDDSNSVQCRLRFVVYQHAELAEAKELLRACKDFEIKNQDIIHHALSMKRNNAER